MTMFLKNFKKKMEITLKMTIGLFFDCWIFLYGVPTLILSDRNIKFKIQFWEHVMKKLGSKIILITSWLLQRDGQIERLNRILSMYLRHYV